MNKNVLPLAGVQVLDLATFLAGPFCGTILGEFGAEVIKIERPEGGDPLRQFGTRHECGDALLWLQEARNKKSVTLDLRTQEGANLLKRLARQSDVLIENFRTGTLEKWGIGWEILHKLNPRLIMLRITGYGQTGPRARDPGFARIAHAFGGLSYLAGEPDGAPLMPGSTTLGDYLSGVYGALGVLLALRARESIGEGQYIDIGLYEPVFRFLDEIAPTYAHTGFVRERMGADTVNVVPHSHYPTADDRWVAIACTNDRMFARLAKAMGRPQLAAPKHFGTMAVRLERRAEVNEIVTIWTSSLSQEEILERCRENEVPSGPIHNIADIFTDAQYEARENLVKMFNDRVPEITMPCVLPRLSATPGRIEKLGPALGEHNKEILEQLVGVDAEALELLTERGII